MLLWEYDMETEIAIKSRDARSEGKGEGKAEMAIRLFGKGMSSVVVSEVADMPIEWVEDLITKAQVT